jgi:hypothetical protein
MGAKSVMGATLRINALSKHGCHVHISTLALVELANVASWVPRSQLHNCPWVPRSALFLAAGLRVVRS